MAADFFLQPAPLVRAKLRGQWWGFALHGLIHFAASLLALGLCFGPGFALSQAALAALVATVHAASDYGFTRAGPETLARQFGHAAWHALAIALLAFLLVPPTPGEFAAVRAWLASMRLRLLISAAVYVLVVFGGGFLIRQVTRPMLDQLEGQGGLRNAGLYIGWLERFLVLSALLVESPATVGLILTAKSIARFPEMKDLKFAEYFLIGTLLSISLALAGGIALLPLVHGTLSLK
jgi:hypothetical protein